MNYDQWKTTDPRDLAPDYDVDTDRCDRCGDEFPVRADDPRPAVVLCDRCWTTALQTQQRKMHKGAA